MRKRITTLIAAVLLATVHGAAAQDAPTKPVPPPEVPAVGLFDIGFRGTSVDGDEARHERYRDLRSGASTFFEMQKNTERYRFGASFTNAGYRDQRYQAEYYNPKVTVTGLYDGIPINYMYDAPLIWTGDGRGKFTLDPALRQMVQGRPMRRTMERLWACPARRDSDRQAATPPRRRRPRRTDPSTTTSSKPTTCRSCGRTPRCSMSYRSSPTMTVKVDFSTTGRSGDRCLG